MEDRGKTVERVRKLLSLASDRGATRAEAVSAALKAQKLIADNGIEDGELDNNAEPRRIVNSAADARTRALAEGRLAACVAVNFRCKSWSKGTTCRGKTQYFYGYEDDAQAASMTYDCLVKVMKQEGRLCCDQARDFYGSATGVYRTFCKGFVAGVQAELEKQSQALMLVMPLAVAEGFAELSRDFNKARKARCGEVVIDASGEGYQVAIDAIRSSRMDGQLALEN